MAIFTRGVPYASQSIIKPAGPPPVTTAYMGNGTALPQWAYPPVGWLHTLLHPISGASDYAPIRYVNSPAGANGLPFNPVG